jgi:hypothetical protein
MMRVGWSKFDCAGNARSLDDARLDAGQPIDRSMDTLPIQLRQGRVI